MPESDRRRGGKGDVGRQERLATELRANLKRRKDRERARERGEKASEHDAGQVKGGSG